MVTIDEARALFEWRRDAWLNEDLDAYVGCFTEDLVLQTPMGAPIQGRAAYTDLVRRSLAAMRPVAFDFHELAVRDNVVMAEWTITLERRADAQRLSYRGMSICELQNGLIRWWREYYDASQLRRPTSRQVQSPTRWDRWRPLVRVANRVEAVQLRVFGTSGIAVSRRRTVLLLETIGRRTGKRRRTAVTYWRDPDGSYVIGGGAGGMTKVDWVANLRNQPHVRIRVKRRTIDVATEELTGTAYDAARAEARRRFPETDNYERVSGRPIPYFRLVPAAENGAVA